MNMNIENKISNGLRRRERQKTKEETESRSPPMKGSALYHYNRYNVIPYYSIYISRRFELCEVTGR